METTRSGFPIFQPSGNAGAGGRSRGFPCFVPPSTQARMVSNLAAGERAVVSELTVVRVRMPRRHASKRYRFPNRACPGTHFRVRHQGHGCDVSRVMTADATLVK